MHSIYSFLTKATEHGHTALTSGLASEYVKSYRLRWDSDLDPLYKRGDLIRLAGDPTLICDPKALTGEARIARFLALQRARGGGVGYPLPPCPEAGYSPAQRVSWEGLRRTGAACLTGLPGTGKTWLTARIVEALDAQGLDVWVCAPTGKAASVLTLKLGRKHEATTIHRLLGLRPGQFPTRTRVYPIESQVVVVDESSMVDAELMGYLLDALRPETRLLLVGDPNQLPPVGAGCPFRDIVEGHLLPVFHLDQIQRQAEGNGIISLAHSIVGGRAVLPDRNVHTFRMAPDRMEAEVVDLYCSDRLRDRFGLTNIQREFLVLSPVRAEKFEASITNINETISHRLFPERTISRSKFTAGDRVMFNVNNPGYGFVNGEVGVLDSYDRKLRQAKITNDLGFTYELEDYSLADYVEWAYGQTIHKAQGSEARVVALLLHPAAGFMYTRNLVYTAVTRAVEELLLFGDPALLQRAVERKDHRYTALPRLIDQPDLCEQIIRKTTVTDLSGYMEDYF